jgi:hypothetical protein
VGDLMTGTVSSTASSIRHGQYKGLVLVWGPGAAQRMARSAEVTEYKHRPHTGHGDIAT